MKKGWKQKFPAQIPLCRGTKLLFIPFAFCVFIDQRRNVWKYYSDEVEPAEYLHQLLPDR